MELRTNTDLGMKVHEALLREGIEMPMRDWFPGGQDSFSVAQRKKVIAGHFAGIMAALGLDLNDDSLKGTPDRVARMYLDEVFSGLAYQNFPDCTTIQNKMYTKNEFVLERDVTIHSTCEHHFVVIDGVAQIAYVPMQKVIGLSKLNRIAHFFAKRPQVQERLTRQIAVAIKTICECEDVAVMVDAVHYCVKSRGITDQNSSTVTFCGLGRFDLEAGSRGDSGLRAEFLAQVRSK